jgi:NADPH:quinone reductase-like Zn-dependent oxidoreductase
LVLRLEIEAKNKMHFPLMLPRKIVFRAKGKAGDTVLIHGASGQVGLACVQVAVAFGLAVYGTASTEDGLTRVLDNGAKAVFNHREENYTNKIKVSQNFVTLLLCNVVTCNFVTGAFLGFF